MTGITNICLKLIDLKVLHVIILRECISPNEIILIILITLNRVVVVASCQPFFIGCSDESKRRALWYRIFLLIATSDELVVSIDILLQCKEITGIFSDDATEIIGRLVEIPAVEN
jgi:hypothetical protein